MSASEGMPVACTLQLKDLKERQAWIRRVTDESLLSHRLHANSLTLVYRRAALEHIHAIVQKERVCCAFLDFDVQARAQDVVLTITSPPEVRESARWLFAQFLPGPVPRA